MKKFFSVLVTLTMVVGMVSLTSCKGKGDNGAPSDNQVSSVLDKYDETGDLSDADFNVLLDYVEEAADEMAKPYRDYMKAQRTKDVALESRAKEMMNKISDKYSYFEEVGEILEDNEDYMSRSVKRRYDRMVKKFGKIFRPTDSAAPQSHPGN